MTTGCFLRYLLGNICSTRGPGLQSPAVRARMTDSGAVAPHRNMIAMSVFAAGSPTTTQEAVVTEHLT